MELNDWLTNVLRHMFDDRVLAITEDIMLKWRLLVEEGRKTGHTFAQPDLMIAATALHHGLTVVSRNTRRLRKSECTRAESMDVSDRRGDRDTASTTSNVAKPPRPQYVPSPAQSRNSRRFSLLYFR
ncbi:MAG TPA: PIN domain-containing protein [Thermoanaerobaculia bacterium]|nr:PIN domain-containing protein [Thermoanaerobaculia bacterium]